MQKQRGRPTEDRRSSAKRKPSESLPSRGLLFPFCRGLDGVRGERASGGMVVNCGCQCGGEPESQTAGSGAAGRRYTLLSQGCGNEEKRDRNRRRFFCFFLLLLTFPAPPSALIRCHGRWVGDVCNVVMYGMAMECIVPWPKKAERRGREGGFYGSPTCIICLSFFLFLPFSCPLALQFD